MEIPPAGVLVALAFREGEVMKGDCAYLSVSGRLLSVARPDPNEPGNLYPVDLEADPDHPLHNYLPRTTHGATVTLWGEQYAVNDLGPAECDGDITLELVLLGKGD